MLDNSTLKDIFELRIVIEIGMADLIFQHKNSEDIAELYEITKNGPENSDDVLFDITHEVKFHGKLYEIKKNETLKKFQQILLPVFTFIYESDLIKKPIRKKTHVSLKELVDVLKNGTPDKFRSAMRKHLENHFQRLYNY